MLTRRTHLIGLGCLAAAGAVQAQPMMRPRPFGRRGFGGPGGPRRLRRGVSIHNALNWPAHTHDNPVTYEWPPFSGPSYRIAPETLGAMRGLGFDFVRLTLDPAIFLAVDPAKRDELSTIVISRVRFLQSAGLFVILDLHPVAENPAFAPEVLLAQGSPAFGAYLNLVHSLAGVLRNMPGDQFALELFNEPTLTGPGGAQRWQAMAQQLHAAARSAAPTLALVIGGRQWNGLRQLMELDTAPFRGSNVYYTFHYYDPHLFTHQGIGMDDPEGYVEGLLWPPVPAQVQAFERQAQAAVDASATLNPSQKSALHGEIPNRLSGYLSEGNGPQRVRNEFAQLEAWGRRNGLDSSRIILGEFNARMLPNETPMHTNARLFWIQTVRQNAEAFGFPWAIWGLKGAGGMQLLQPNSDTAADPGLAHALGLRV